MGCKDLGTFVLPVPGSLSSKHSVSIQVMTETAVSELPIICSKPTGEGRMENCPNSSLRGGIESLLGSWEANAPTGCQRAGRNGLGPCSSVDSHNLSNQAVMFIWGCILGQGSGHLGKAVPKVLGVIPGYQGLRRVGRCRTKKVGTLQVGFFSVSNLVVSGSHSGSSLVIARTQSRGHCLYSERDGLHTGK